MKMKFIFPVALTALALSGCMMTRPVGTTTVEPTVAPGTSQVNPSTGGTSVNPSTGGTSVNPTNPTSATPTLTIPTSSSSDEGGTQISASTVTLPSTPEPIDDDDCPLNYMRFNQSEYIIKKGKYEYPTLSYDPNPFDFGDGDLVYTSSDESIATVHPVTGKMTGISKGSCYITATYKNQRRCYASIYIYENDASITKEFRKVTDTSTLKSNDIIVLGEPTNKVTATEERTAGYLHPVTSTFSADGSKITSLGEGTAQFILGWDESKGGFTMESQNGKYIAAKNTENVEFINNTGNKWWTFEDYEQGCCIESTSNVSGWWMYNSQHQRFTLYEDDHANQMYLVQVYRLTTIIS